MAHIIRLIVIVAFMNFAGFLFYEGYLESTELLVIFNILAIGAWIYTIFRNKDE